MRVKPLLVWLGAISLLSSLLKLCVELWSALSRLFFLSRVGFLALGSIFFLPTELMTRVQPLSVWLKAISLF